MHSPVLRSAPVSAPPDEVEFEEIVPKKHYLDEQNDEKQSPNDNESQSIANHVTIDHNLDPDVDVTVDIDIDEAIDNDTSGFDSRTVHLSSTNFNLKLSSNELNADTHSSDNFLNKADLSNQFYSLKRRGLKGEIICIFI